MQIQNRSFWIIIPLLAVVLLGACEKEKQAPSIPIPQEQLVPVLADAYIAEAAINSLIGSVKDSMAAVYYAQLCEIHDIRKADLDSTINIMQEHPSFMDSIYKKVLLHLTELETVKKDAPINSEATEPKATKK